MRFLPIASVVLLGMLSNVSVAADAVEAYLDKEGQLTATLEIKDVQGGFAGFTGKKFTVEPDGKWALADVLPGDKIDVKSKGKLNKTHVKEIAEILLKYDQKTLMDEGKETVNPHVVTVSFGKKSAVLTLMAGEKLPKADAKSKAGRFAGIVAEITHVIEKK